MNELDRFLTDKFRELRVFRWKWLSFYAIGTGMSITSVLLVRYQLFFRPEFSSVSQLLSYLKVTNGALAVVIGFVGFITAILFGQFLKHWLEKNQTINQQFKEIAANHLNGFEQRIERYESLDAGLMTCLWVGVSITLLTLMGLVLFVHFQQEMILRTLGSPLNETDFIQSLSLEFSRQATGSVIRLMIIGLSAGLIFLVHYYRKKRTHFIERVKNEVLSHKFDDRLVIRRSDDTRFISYFMVEDISLRAVQDEGEVYRYDWKEFDQLLGDQYKLVTDGVVLNHAKEQAEWYREDVFSQ